MKNPYFNINIKEMQNNNHGYIYSVIKKLKDFFIAIAEGELAVESQR